MFENGRSVWRKCFLEEEIQISEDKIVSSEEVDVSFESHYTTKEMSEAKVTRGHVCTSLVATILLSPPKIVRCVM